MGGLPLGGGGPIPQGAHLAPIAREPHLSLLPSSWFHQIELLIAVSGWGNDTYFLIFNSVRSLSFPREWFGDTWGEGSQSLLALGACI